MFGFGSFTIIRSTDETKTNKQRIFKSKPRFTLETYSEIKLYIGNQKKNRNNTSKTLLSLLEEIEIKLKMKDRLGSLFVKTLSLSTFYSTYTYTPSISSKRILSIDKYNICLSTNRGYSDCSCGNPYISVPSTH